MNKEKEVSLKMIIHKVLKVYKNSNLESNAARTAIANDIDELMKFKVATNIYGLKVKDWFNKLRHYKKGWRLYKDE
tara:strand:+ start:512 stop:739 length:228 start_codon:yes stop_codon:yes gene_type:complete